MAKGGGVLVVPTYDEDSDAVEANVTDAVETFRLSLRLLVDPASNLFMSWREDDAHPDWQSLEISLFDVFVRNFLAASREWSDGYDPIATYGTPQPAYGNISWLCPIDEPRLALIQFVSTSHPFDRVRFAGLNDAGDIEFFTDRTADGQHYAVTNNTRLRNRLLSTLTVID